MPGNARHCRQAEQMETFHNGGNNNDRQTRSLEGCTLCAGTALKTLIWKRGISKQGILKSPVSHVLNFLGWIKLIFDTSDLYNFVIDELNPT